jgi:hypothetical protein
MVFNHRRSPGLTNISGVTSHVGTQTFTKPLPVKYNSVYPDFMLFISVHVILQQNKTKECTVFSSYAVFILILPRYVSAYLLPFSRGITSVT